jgi:hypothetical protein
VLGRTEWRVCEVPQLRESRRKEGSGFAKSLVGGLWGRGGALKPFHKHVIGNFSSRSRGVGLKNSANGTPNSCCYMEWILLFLERK